MEARTMTDAANPLNPAAVAPQAPKAESIVDVDETDDSRLSPEELAAAAGEPAPAPAPAPQPAPQPLPTTAPGETITVNAADLERLINARVEAAVAATRPAPAPAPIKAKTFVQVKVCGNMVEALNRHVSNIVNFEETVNMPSDYTMGDLKRSLPHKLARKYTGFKRLREVESHTVLGPAHVDAKTGKVPSDYVVPRKLPQQIANAHINRAEGVEEEEPGGQTIQAVGGAVQFDDSNIDPLTGLPPIVR